MSESVKNGIRTSEWMAMIGMVLTALVAAGTSVLDLGGISEGSVGYVIIASVVSVAGVVMSYINSRTKVKVAQSVAKAYPDYGPDPT